MTFAIKKIKPLPLSILLEIPVKSFLHFECRMVDIFLNRGKWWRESTIKAAIETNIFVGNFRQRLQPWDWPNFSFKLVLLSQFHFLWVWIYYRSSVESKASPCSMLHCPHINYEIFACNRRPVCTDCWMSTTKTTFGRSISSVGTVYAAHK